MTAHFDEKRLRCAGVPQDRLKSRMVQALQAHECLRLVERAERTLLASNGTFRTASSSAPHDLPRRRYASILRARADLLVTAPIRLPRVLAPENAVGAARKLAMYSSLVDCPPHASQELAPHDFALFGERAVMRVLLGTLDGLSVDEFERSGCDFGVAARARLRRSQPRSRCAMAPPAPQPGGTRAPLVIGDGGGAVASVRGSVPSGCFFVDQEHPPNDDKPQPRLTSLYAGASDVAEQCLGLIEGEDGRRRRTGASRGGACEPRGGWDGDFREAASPWDTTSTTNRGPGRALQTERKPMQDPTSETRTGD